MIVLEMRMKMKTRTDKPPLKRPRPRVIERRISLAKQLANKNGGKLPSPWKLIQMGHEGLYRYMLRNSGLFTEIQRESVITRKRDVPSINETIKDKHLETIKKLIAKHGSLPDSKWLSEHGHNKLVAYMKNHPDAFKEAV